MSAWQRIASYVFLLLVVVGGGVSLDALSSPSARVTASAPTSPSVAREPGRAFVFIIDSLRYETAMDAAMMPHLAALRARSTFARVTPSNDAVTVPSIRAAFTGQEQTKLLGFVSNFLKSRAGVESVFTDLARDRRRAVAFSDDAFRQFGEEVVETLSNGDDGPTEVRDQNRTIAEALGLYGRGRHDLVVMHITYTDHVAHEDGVGSPQYAERFRQADAMVDAIDRAVPPRDTVVVMGDHGHDERGRHSFGLDVPTFAAYRGVRFLAAQDLGTIPIRDHRYLLGWALGLPLPAEYDGARHPDALVSHGELPRDYASVDAAGAPDAAERSARHVAYLATTFDLVAAFVVWTFVAGPLAGASPGGLVALAWASTAGRFLSPGSSFGAACGIAASVICLFWLLLHRRREPLADRWVGSAATIARRVGAAVGAATAVWALGLFFPMIRPTFHEPTYERIALFWSVVWIGAIGISWSKRDARYGAAILLLPLFFFIPTVYRYGSAAAMAPAWAGILLCLLVAAPRGALVVVAPAVLLLTPFSAVDSSDFKFDEWVLYPHDKSPIVWAAGALIGKAILLWRPSFRSRWWLPSILTIAMVVFEWHRRPFLEEAFAATLLGYAAWAYRRRMRTGVAPSKALLVDGERIAWIAGLLMAHHALTRIEPEAYLWRDWLLAAILLSARAVRDFVPPFTHGPARAVLLFLSLLATGWVTFAWTVHRLEWGFLYDWFSAPFLERHVVFFLPLILGRYVAPLIVARLVLAEVLGRESPYPARAVWTLAGWKIASLFLLTVGIGSSSPATEIYLEGAEETAICGVLAAGLL